MKNIIKNVVKNKFLVFAVMCAYVLCYIGVVIGRNNWGIESTLLTGLIAIMLSLACFSYFALSAVNELFITRLFMSVGSLMIFVEYSASVFLKINLNQYASMFWCDCGVIFLIAGVLYPKFLYIYDLLKKDAKNDTVKL